MNAVVERLCQSYAETSHDAAMRHLDGTRCPLATLIDGLASEAAKAMTIKLDQPLA
jgi:hypothetical protein